MRHLKVKLAYDGTDFHGWQIQPDLPTVQGTVESVLDELEGGPVSVDGAGRTDAGVHALEQVASFSLRNPMPLANLRKAMNRLLPETIRALDVEGVKPSFHARHSATGKLYEYRIWRPEVCPPTMSRYVYPHPFPLDEAAMIEAAPHFTGTHDFRSLAATGGQEKETTIRTIFCSTVERKGSLLLYRVRGSGFLYNMVRNIVGTLLEVGRGRLSAEDIGAVLAEKKRAAAGPTAPARGLFLVTVKYDEPAAG